MNRSHWIFFAVITVLATAVPAPGQDIVSGLLGHWRMTETSGTTACDATSTAQNGTYTNGVSLASSTPAPKDGAISATFDGVDDYVAVGGESTFDTTGAMTVACWIKVGAFNKQWQAIITKGDTAWRLTRDDTNNGVAFSCNGLTTPLVASLTSVNDGQWHHVVGVYTGSQLLIYVDGALNNSVNSSGAVSTNNTAVRIGANAAAAGREFNGALYDARVYGRALSATEVSTIYNLTGLLAQWKLDQTSGASAFDSSPYGNQGTYVNGVALAATGPFPGTGNVAASFDGSDDYVSTTNEFLYDIRGPITVAAWIKVGAFTVGSQAIVAKGNSAWRLIRSGSTNKVRFTCNGLSTTYVDTTSDLNDGRWHHIVGVYDGSSLSIYVDGALEGAVSSTGRIGVNNNNVYIGENSGAAGKYWNGSIHDVRVYSVALSTTQIADMYGLIGLWKLGEASGSTATDSSLFALNGTLNGSQNWATSCDGTGVFDFDASANFFSVTNASHLQPTSAMTIAAWVKGDSWGSGAEVNTILRKGEGNPNNYQLAIADGHVAFYLDDSNGAGIRGNTQLVAGQWYHVAATWDGSTVKIYVNGQLDNTPTPRSGTIGIDTRPLYIGGRAGADYFDGMIYDVRIFNRASSDVEIAMLYGLCGHWAFSEGFGVTAADSSPLGNTANLINGATWTSDCAGVNALQTDGAGGIAQTTSAFKPPVTGTLAFWMRPPAPPRRRNAFSAWHRIGKYANYQTAP